MLLFALAAQIVRPSLATNVLVLDPFQPGGIRPRRRGAAPLRGGRGAPQVVRLDDAAEVLVGQGAPATRGVEQLANASSIAARSSSRGALFQTFCGGCWTTEPLASSLTTTCASPAVSPAGETAASS